VETRSNSMNVGRDRVRGIVFIVIGQQPEYASKVVAHAWAVPDCPCFIGLLSVRPATTVLETAQQRR